MKPSDRFTKKTWRKPPKKDAKGFKLPNKTGLVKCEVCKQPINSSSKRKARNNFKITKSRSRTNRPYGGRICTKCFRDLITKKTHELESQA